MEGKKIHIGNHYLYEHERRKKKNTSVESDHSRRPELLHKRKRIERQQCESGRVRSRRRGGAKGTGRSRGKGRGTTGRERGTTG